MDNNKPIIAHLENAQISVGLAYKMHMHKLTEAEWKDRNLFWNSVEADAIQMIKSSANVMRKLQEKPTEEDDDKQTKVDDHTKDKDGGPKDCKD